MNCDECKEKLKTKMYRLDWIKILQKAIDMRPTSWYPLGFEPRIFIMPDGTHEETKKYSPAEWRNASDEVCGAVIRAMEGAEILKPLLLDPIRAKRKCPSCKSDRMFNGMVLHKQNCKKIKTRCSDFQQKLERGKK